MDTSENILLQIRRLLSYEVLAQILIFTLFFSVLFSKNLAPIPKVVYTVSIFIASLITLIYLIKIVQFLVETKPNKNIDQSRIQGFIVRLENLLQVYKIAVFAGSLLLPPALIALIFKNAGGEEFFKILELENDPTSLLTLLGRY